MKKDAIRLLNAVKDYQMTNEEIHLQTVLDLIRPLMKSKTRKYHQRWWPDLESVIAHGVWKTVSGFKFIEDNDEINASRLLAAIGKAMDSRITDFVRSKYFRETNSYISLEEMQKKHSDEEGKPRDIADLFPERLSVTDDHDDTFMSAIGLLPENDRRFIEGYLACDCNASEYARKRGISRQAIQKRLLKIRKNLKEFQNQGCQNRFRSVLEE